MWTNYNKQKYAVQPFPNRVCSEKIKKKLTPKYSASDARSSRLSCAEKVFEVLNERCNTTDDTRATSSKRTLYVIQLNNDVAKEWRHQGTSSNGEMRHRNCSVGSATFSRNSNKCLIPYSVKSRISRLTLRLSLSIIVILQLVPCCYERFIAVLNRFCASNHGYPWDGRVSPPSFSDWQLILHSLDCLANRRSLLIAVRLVRCCFWFFTSHDVCLARLSQDRVQTQTVETNVVAQGSNKYSSHGQW